MPDSENAEKIMEIGRNLAAQISTNNINSANQKVEILLGDD